MAFPYFLWCPLFPMLPSCSAFFFLILTWGQAYSQTYSATYLPSNVPAKTEQGQSGTNQCGTTASQSSTCQNIYVNSLEDFCIFGPPEPGPNSDIGNTERIEVAWCTQDGHGTRLIPDGTFSGVHFVQTPDYVQLTGVGDLTKINIPENDEGGELDPHGADGNGNPIGGLVFSNAFGSLVQIHEWTNFVAYNEFCIRACKDGPNAAKLCNHIYDILGCEWNMPANYDPGVFESCKGDDALPMGIYGSSTFYQGEPVTPPAHPIPSSSSCTKVGTMSQGEQASTTSGSTSTTTTGSASSGSGAVTTTGASGGKSSSSTTTSSVAASTTSNKNSAYSLSSCASFALALAGYLLGTMLAI